MHVPYRGGAQAATDAISGQIEMVSMGLASTRVAESGQLRILAQTGPSRHPMLPDVPTTAEARPAGRADGNLVRPDRAARHAEGDRRAPRRASSTVVAKQPAFQDKLAKIGCAVDFQAATPSSCRSWPSETKKWRELIPAMGIPIRSIENGSEQSWRRRHGEEAEDADLAERQEGRRLGHGDVRDLAGRQRAELFGADHASETGTVDHAAKAWSTYGGRVGVWRLINMLDRLGIPATFFVNARCTEEYPDAVKQIVKSGLDLAAHSYTQDDLLAYMPLDEQQALIRKSIDLLEGLRRQEGDRLGQPGGRVHAGDRGLPQAKAGLNWTSRRDLRRSADQDPHAARPDRRRADHRLLRQPRDARLAARSVRRASRHLRLPAPRTSRSGLQTLVIHCQFGGRPLITAVLTELLKYMQKSRDVWFTTHEALADWALAPDVDEHTYQSRYFADAR